MRSWPMLLRREGSPVYYYRRDVSLNFGRFSGAGRRSGRASEPPTREGGAPVTSPPRSAQTPSRRTLTPLRDSTSPTCSQRMPRGGPSGEVP